MAENRKNVEQVRSHHIDGAVGKIDQLQDAVDHGIADGSQRVVLPRTSPLPYMPENFPYHLPRLIEISAVGPDGFQMIAVSGQAVQGD